MNSQWFGSSCSPFCLTQLQLGMLLSILKLTWCALLAALNFYPSSRFFGAEVFVISDCLLGIEPLDELQPLLLQSVNEGKAE